MNNFKVRCIKAKSNYFVEGAVCEVINGRLYDKEGYDVVVTNCNSIQDIHENIESRFELVEEPKSVNRISESKIGCDYESMFNRAMGELKELQEKNIPRDNYAKIGERVYRELFDNINFKEVCSKNTFDLFDFFGRNLDLREDHIDSILEDFAKYRSKEDVELWYNKHTESKFEVERLNAVNEVFSASNIELEKKVDKLRECLLKHYEFIDKLLPERIEV